MPLDIQYFASGGAPESWPSPTRPEIVLLGRSNSGKSSIINAMSKRDVARVSQVPGKTTALNFYTAGKNYILTDVPGYGFASRSNAEISQWQGMVESYLLERETLAGAVLLMDLRRDWTDEEQGLIDFLYRRDRPFVLALTKADKCSESERRTRKASLQRQSGAKDIFLISNTKKMGVEDLEKFIFEEFVKTWRPEGEE